MGVEGVPDTAAGIRLCFLVSIAVESRDGTIRVSRSDVIRCGLSVAVGSTDGRLKLVHSNVIHCGLSSAVGNSCGKLRLVHS